MSYTNEPITGARVPDHNEKLADIWKAEGFLAADLATKTVMPFANMADLVAKLVGPNAPKPGMIAFVADVGQWLGYVGGAWHRIYPVERQTFVGTALPPASLGAVGDIYLQF